MTVSDQFPVKWKQKHTGNVDVELRAAREQTETAVTTDVLEETGEDTGFDVGGVTVVGLVAAVELSLVTALGLGLLDGHVLRDREVLATGVSGDRGSEGEDGGNGGQRELHFDGLESLNDWFKIFLFLRI